jgi:hypothetical protein
MMTPSCGGNDMDSVGDDASGGGGGGGGGWEGSGGLLTALLLQFRLPGIGRRRAWALQLGKQSHRRRTNP